MNVNLIEVLWSQLILFYLPILFQLSIKTLSLLELWPWSWKHCFWTQCCYAQVVPICIPWFLLLVLAYLLILFFKDHHGASSKTGGALVAHVININILSGISQCYMGTGAGVTRVSDLADLLKPRQKALRIWHGCWCLTWLQYQWMLFNIVPNIFICQYWPPPLLQASLLWIFSGLSSYSLGYLLCLNWTMHFTYIQILHSIPLRYMIDFRNLFDMWIRSKIVFKTAGVVLEQMCDRGIAALRYKVIILDEVHERSVESDLVLASIRQFLMKKSDLR